MISRMSIHRVIMTSLFNCVTMKAHAVIYYNIYLLTFYQLYYLLATLADLEREREGGGLRGLQLFTEHP